MPVIEPKYDFPTDIGEMMDAAPAITSELRDKRTNWDLRLHKLDTDTSWSSIRVDPRLNDFFFSRSVASPRSRSQFHPAREPAGRRNRLPHPR